MKKIGVLYGMERSFPYAFVDHGNAIAPDGIKFEHVRMGAPQQNVPSDYAVILDRISQDVPFYRAALKHAALLGCAVINNPFWWSAEDKLTANAMAERVGVPVPKTVLLPSKDHPVGTTAASFTNLQYPLGWDKMFAHVGFPAFMKPNTGGGWKSVYKVDNADELWSAYDDTEELNMLLQEAIDFEAYFRCYCIGGKYVRVMQYDPRKAFHERYVRDAPHVEPELLEKLEDYVVRLNKVLGYDFNTVELAVRGDVVYAIDFTNPAPDADVHSVGQQNFEWVVDHAAKYAIERAEAHEDGSDNLTWGDYMLRSVGGAPAPTSKPAAKAKPVAKAKTPAKSKAATTTKRAAPTKKKPAARTKPTTKPTPKR